MKKVLALVESRNPNSKTYKTVERIKIKVGELSKDIQFEIIRPNEYHLLPVAGTVDQFSKGIDPVDSVYNDEGRKLKKKIIESDFLIIGTPTYYQSVSSDMKLIIDRTAHWTHLFYLNGKPGLTLVSADGNGFIQVSSFVRQYSEGLGIRLVDELVQTTRRPIDEEKIFKVAQSIIYSMNNPSKLQVSANMEAVFRSFQATFKNQRSFYAERQYWESSGLMKSPTLKDYFSSLENNL